MWKLLKNSKNRKARRTAFELLRKLDKNVFDDLNLSQDDIDIMNGVLKIPATIKVIRDVSQTNSRAPFVMCADGKDIGYLYGGESVTYETNISLNNITVGFETDLMGKKVIMYPDTVTIEVSEGAVAEIHYRPNEIFRYDVKSQKQF